MKKKNIHTYETKKITIKERQKNKNKKDNEKENEKPNK